MSDNNPNEPFRCIVDADLMRRAHFCVADEYEYREYLKGVTVESLDDGSAILVGTDGRALVALRDANAFITGGPAIVRLAGSFLDKIRDISNDGVATRVIIDGERAGLISASNPATSADDAEAMFADLRDLTDRVFAFQYRETIVRAKPINWRKAIDAANFQRHDEYSWQTFNAKYLRMVAAALCENEEKHPVFMRKIGDGIAPYLVRALGKIDGFGAIMPIRIDIPAQLPEWAKPAPSPAPAAEEPAQGESDV